MTQFAEETAGLAESVADNIKAKFITEVKRLLACKCVDPDDHHRGVLFGAALENIADEWLRGYKHTPEYKNIRRF